MWTDARQPCTLHDTTGCSDPHRSEVRAGSAALLNRFDGRGEAGQETERAGRVGELVEGSGDVAAEVGDAEQERRGGAGVSDHLRDPATGQPARQLVAQHALAVADGEGEDPVPVSRRAVEPCCRPRAPRPVPWGSTALAPLAEASAASLGDQRQGTRRCRPGRAVRRGKILVSDVRLTEGHVLSACSAKNTAAHRVQPPSVGMTVPNTYDASGEASHHSTAAASAPLPRRCAGTVVRIDAWNSGSAMVSGGK